MTKQMDCFCAKEADGNGKTDCERRNVPGTEVGTGDSG